MAALGGQSGIAMGPQCVQLETRLKAIPKMPKKGPLADGRISTVQDWPTHSAALRRHPIMAGRGQKSGSCTCPLRRTMTSPTARPGGTRGFGVGDLVRVRCEFLIEQNTHLQTGLLRVAWTDQIILWKYSTGTRSCLVFLASPCCRAPSSGQSGIHMFRCNSLSPPCNLRWELFRSGILNGKGGMQARVWDNKRPCLRFDPVSILVFALKIGWTRAL